MIQICVRCFRQLWGFLTERDTADCKAHDLAHCVGNAPPSIIGAPTVELVWVVKTKIASDPGKITIRNKVPVEGTLIQAAATSWSMPSCPLAEIVTESGSSSGPKDVHQDGITLATGQKGDDNAAAPTLSDCASTDPSCSLSASTLDLTEVDASDLSALPSSVVRVVTERDTADGNAHALAQCVGTAPPSGIGASTVVLVEVGAPKIAIGPGKMTIGDEVAVEWTLIQVAATNLSMPSCSLAEVVTESGSSSGAKGVQRDVAEYATGRKGDEDVATATLPDCVSSADLPVYNVVTVEMVTGQNYTCQVRPETTLAELKLLTQNSLGLPT